MLDTNLFSFTVSSDTLHKAMKSLAGVVPKTPVPSIIGNIVVALQPDGFLRLQATDLQEHVVILVKVSDAMGEGAICIPSERIKSISDSIKSGNILFNINLSGFDMLVSAGKKDASIKGFDSALFPTLDQSNKINKNRAVANMPIDLFRDMVKKVSIAAALDDSRPYLTGVQIVFEDDKMTMIATDSFRASFAECEAIGQPNLSTILPAASLKSAADTLSELANINTVSIIVLDNSVQLVADNVSIQLTPLSGIYPKVKPAFTSTQKTNMTVVTKDMLEAIRFVTSFDGDLIITSEAVGGGNGLLKMYCADGQSGEGNDAIDILLKGNPIKVTMNATYLEPHIALYNALKIPNLVLQFNGNNTPMIIRPCWDGQIDESFASIVMPLKESK